MVRCEARIAQDLLDEPHIRGRRIPVLTIAERIEGRGLKPKTVANRFSLDMSEVYAALLYYHDHPREFACLRREREDVMKGIEKTITRPEGLDPE